MSENEAFFKIITLGDSKVGKTSIIKRITLGSFEDESFSTVGIVFSFKEIIIKDGIKVKLKLIDTAGQERFNRAIPKSYYKNADAVLFVFAYDDELSFDHIEEWLTIFKENSSENENIPLYLIGNKFDVENKKITNDSIEELKNKIGINNFAKTSAKSNFGIDELINEVAEKLYELNKKNLGKKQAKRQLINEKEVKKKSKCVFCSVDS